MCTSVEMMRFTEVCDEVPRMVQEVECETRMKEIELKEICVDIELQLPREECRTEEKEECRYEPRREIVQRCEPTVREVCHPKTETVCNQKCELVSVVKYCVYFYLVIIQAQSSVSRRIRRCV